MVRAREGPTPGVCWISPTVAVWSLGNEPNRFSRAFFRAGPTPGTSSRGERRARLARLARRSPAVPVAFGHQAGEPPPQDLLHGCEIVLSENALDLELAVIAPLGQSVLEHDHRADLVSGAQVRDVVSLDAQRGQGKTEH